MSALTENLFEALKELNFLKSLGGFALGGGTNLALVHEHRRSIDIDLFAHDNIGKGGFESIEKEVRGFFGSNCST